MRNKIANVSLYAVLLLSTLGVGAQTVVHNSRELSSVLRQNKDFGIIYLDGDEFCLGTTNVVAGGTVLPASGRTPVITPQSQVLLKRISKAVGDGSWIGRVICEKARDFIVLDGQNNLIPFSTVTIANDKSGNVAKDILRMDKSKRLVKFLIPEQLKSLAKKSTQELQFCTIKVSYWFVCFNINNLHSDAKYFYGTIDTEYNYNLLSIHPDTPIQMSFFNIPLPGNGVYLDGNNFLHVPDRYEEVKFFEGGKLLLLSGERSLTFEGITFAGAYSTVEVSGPDKHFKNCIFKNCCYGITCNYGVANKDGRCSVENCSFSDLYNNVAIKFLGCNNIVIANNILTRTGIVNKGGSLIDVSGENFQVKGNDISAFSYIAIRVGNTRDYGKEIISGKVSENIIDNIANYGKAECQITDGGGIYIFTHNDNTEVSDNLVRNIGFKNGAERGIFLDDGAYNVKVLRNLVYNIYPGDMAIHARYEDQFEHSCMNNVFEYNIVIGDCLLAGNRKGIGNKTVIRNNYISGDVKTQGDSYVEMTSTKKIKAEIGEDGKLYIDRSNKVKKRTFNNSLRQIFNNRRRIN